MKRRSTIEVHFRITFSLRVIVAAFLISKEAAETSRDHKWRHEVVHSYVKFLSNFLFLHSFGFNRKVANFQFLGILQAHSSEVHHIILEDVIAPYSFEVCLWISKDNQLSWLRRRQLTKEVSVYISVCVSCIKNSHNQFWCLWSNTPWNIKPEQARST